MTYKRSATGFEPDRSTLLHYESLRSQALNRQESFSERSLGLALFIRRGMLAWIELSRRYIPSDSSVKRPPQTPMFACGATSEMIKIMANITLYNLEEAVS